MIRKKITLHGIKSLAYKEKLRAIFGEVELVKPDFYCPMCGGRSFWLSFSHKKVCSNCHPAPSRDQILYQVIEEKEVKPKELADNPKQMDWHIPACRWCLGTKTEPLCSKVCEEKKSKL